MGGSGQETKEDEGTRVSSLAGLQKWGVAPPSWNRPGYFWVTLLWLEWKLWSGMELSRRALVYVRPGFLWWHCKQNKTKLFRQEAKPYALVHTTRLCSPESHWPDLLRHHGISPPCALICGRSERITVLRERSLRGAERREAGTSTKPRHTGIPTCRHTTLHVHMLGPHEEVSNQRDNIVGKHLPCMLPTHGLDSWHPHNSPESHLK